MGEGLGAGQVLFGSVQKEAKHQSVIQVISSGRFQDL
jgi:hypothetical protein